MADYTDSEIEQMLARQAGPCLAGDGCVDGYWADGSECGYGQCEKKLRRRAVAEAEKRVVEAAVAYHTAKFVDGGDGIIATHEALLAAVSALLKLRAAQEPKT